MIKFSHSGKIGDMMYALPYLYDVAKAKNDRVELCIIPGHFDTPVHEVFQFMRPLMELFSEWLHFTHSDSVDKSYISLDEFRQVFGDYRMRAGRHLMQLYYLNSSIPLPMPSIAELIKKTMNLGNILLEKYFSEDVPDFIDQHNEVAFIYLNKKYSSNQSIEDFCKQVILHDQNNLSFSVKENKETTWYYLGLPDEAKWINDQFLHTRTPNSKNQSFLHYKVANANEIVKLLMQIESESKGIFGQGLVYALVQVFGINQLQNRSIRAIYLITEPDYSHLDLPEL